MEAPVFQIQRVFAAEAGEVFDLWTDAVHLLEWLPPPEFLCSYVKADIRSGGLAHYFLVYPDDTKLWTKIQYRQVVRPSRLEYLQSFSDANEGLSQHPFATDFPPQLETVVTFEALGGQTRVTLTWTPYHATPTQNEFFAFAMPGMTQGWNASWDQLARYLERRIAN